MAQGERLLLFLDLLDRSGALPKTILYNLNPRDNALFAAACCCLCCSAIVGEAEEARARAATPGPLFPLRRAYASDARLNAASPAGPGLRRRRDLRDLPGVPAPSPEAFGVERAGPGYPF